MYNILVADDEPRTRNGIVKSLEASFNDVNIFQVRDGNEGIAIANTHAIDIVLSDVRMPRMDGISMCKEIREMYPECVIMFLSGYSDKEYLRSAINIRAFQYIDKPIDTQLLCQAISQAISQCAKHKLSKEFAIDASSQQLAKQLISYTCDDKLHLKLIEQSGLTPSSFNSCVTIVIQLLHELDVSQEKLDFHTIVDKNKKIISALLEKKHIPCLITEHRGYYIIVHLLSNNEHPVNSLSLENCSLICSEISETLSIRHFISVGSVVNRYLDLYLSYNTAALHLQLNFYSGINSIVFHSSYDEGNGNFFCEKFSSFKHFVHLKELAQCQEILSKIENEFHSNPGTLISVTKENYYMLLSWLVQYAKSKSNISVMDTEQYLWELINTANTLSELGAFARNYLSLAFEEITSSVNNTVSCQIKKIINENYQNICLDIQFLSEELKLSSSYLSFLFKQETGNTINHYINEMRIWKAKELLLNSSIKIVDIAQAVGFANQNYFAKTFKKTAGISPSEFRGTTL